MFSHCSFIAILFLCCFGKELLGNEPQVEIITTPESCIDRADGVITIVIPDISQTFIATFYKYSHTGKNIDPQVKNDSTFFTVSDLNAGKYFFEIKGSKGFSFTQSIELPEPEKFSSGKIIVEKKLSALDANDAVLMASPSGGVPPYSYSWNIEGEYKNAQVIKNVGQGTYSCVINDANNCGPLKVTILFNQYVIPDIVEE